MRARATAMAATAATTSFHLGFRANLGLRRLKTSTSSAEAGPPSAAVSKLTQILATATQAGYGRRRPSTVPNCEPATKTEIASLASFIGDKERLLVITGAGCSTESNIPDYRSPTGAYSSGFKPMTHQEFLKTEANQRRYWARSFVGWRRFAEQTAPNDAHRAIATLQNGNNAWRLITQNVDRLHQAAGANEVLELHGSTHDVTCMKCGHLSDRKRLQRQLADLNPRLAAAADAAVNPRTGEAPYDDGVTPREENNLKTRPDGDVELDGEAVVGFIGFSGGEENAVAVMHSAANPSSQLVQLGEAESVGVLNEHQIGVRHIYAHFHHGCGEQDLQSIFIKGPHGLFLFLRFHSPVEYSDLVRGEFFVKLARLFGHGLDAGSRVFVVNPREHHIGLSTCIELLLHELENFRPSIRCSNVSADRAATLREFIDHRTIKIAI